MEKNTELKTLLEAASREISADFTFKELTSGHINQTYLVSNNGEQLILQKLNREVFKNLETITQNILSVCNHLKKKHYPNQVLQLVDFKNGDYLYDGQWRIFEFIDNTQTFLKVTSAKQAYEAAKFLGRFHAYLSDIALDKIQDSIEGFIDFDMRSQQYQKALKKTVASRFKQAENAVLFLEENRSILTNWLALLPQIPTRIIHADSKISNFLFDKEDANKIVALIDWDTLLRGSILYDFGDMVRSYTNLREEDDPEIGNNFSLKNYRALEEGFLFHLKDELTKKELLNLDLGAKVVIYVQAMRFLTDYLNGDVYYATQYDEQNLDRTRSQINLLHELQQQLG